MATKPNYLPNWNNVTPVAPLTKKKNETPVLPAVPVKLGTPVLPSVPVKLATPVLPPVVKKNQTPIKPMGPVVNFSQANKKEPKDTDAELYNWAESIGSKWDQQYSQSNTRYTGTIQDLEDEFTKRISKRVKDPDLANSLSEDLHDGIFTEGGKPSIGAKVLDTYLKTTGKLTKSEDALFHKLLPQVANIHFSIKNDKDPRIGSVDPYWNSGTGGGIREAYIRHAYDLVKLADTLKPAEKETFIALLPEWNGTATELVATAKSLAAD